MDFQISLDAVPNQEIITNLNNQQCKITLRTLGGNTFFSLESSTQGPVCDGVLCVDRSALIRAKYSGFIGDLIFIDTEGQEPPHYTGMTYRWFLLYSPDGYPDE